ncbi:SDR family oxidoreductase [Rhodocaloribacter litoris]|uniref:SDR family NAD(P)-dependent oxidoreductase n=1 Tax=Rhodocaloribacter litoris TaxID=2558931 RepID=UPI00141DDBEB|nr:SDR family oxidoreductase [Rhodocaloribacter litoris]QXD14589.1 SDR family oxidoreductase [Rhodocaloribacter litoris]
MAHDARTALITGASSGIGAGFARRLAERGYNLILVARRADRLAELAEELQTRHGIEAEGLPADLATDEGIRRVEARIVDCDTLDLLVNNAGFGTTGRFAEIDLAPQLAMIHVHVIAPVRLIRAALPGMMARGAGGIINVSSVSAFWPNAGSATYSATKAYLNAFSEALAHELRGTGVTVQALCPGFTRTEFHDTETFTGFDRSLIPDFLWLTTHEVVQASLEALERGRIIVIPRLIYRVLASLGRSALGAYLRRHLGTEWRSLLARKRVVHVEDPDPSSAAETNA